VSVVGAFVLDLYAGKAYNHRMQTEPSPSAKSQRIATRVTGEHKSLFERAAALRGVSLTDFMVNAAYDAAVKTLRDSESILDLCPEDSRFFLETLLKPEASPAHEIPRLHQAASRLYDDAG
jgi:uncharacterized protein (DUF1778 family)